MQAWRSRRLWAAVGFRPSPRSCPRLSPQVALWGFLLPVVYVLASSITNLVFKDALILKARRGGGAGWREGGKAPPAAGQALVLASLALACSFSWAPARGRRARWAAVAPRVHSVTCSRCHAAVPAPQAPCPNCSTENTVYFGDILTIQGNRKESTVPCSNCKTQLTFNALSREVVVADEAAA